MKYIKHTIPLLLCLLVLTACGGEVTPPTVVELSQNQIGQSEPQKEDTQTSEQEELQGSEEGEQASDDSVTSNPCSHPQFRVAVDSQPVWSAIVDWYYANNSSRTCEVCGEWGMKTMCRQLSFENCLESLKNGDCDVIFIPVNDAMLEELEGYVVAPVMQDGIVFIHSNAEECSGFGLTDEKIRLVFTAEETVCWDDENTDPIIPASGWFDTEPSLWQHIGELLGFSATSSNVVFGGENCAQAIEASGRAGSGLWPCYFSSVGGDVGIGNGEMIAVNGVYPTGQTISDGSYPYAFTYCAVYDADSEYAEGIAALVDQISEKKREVQGEETNRLTAEEIQYFTSLFANPDVGRAFPTMLLSSEYDAPENIHLGWLFRESIPNEDGSWGCEVSEEELKALRNVLTEEEYDAFLMYDVHKTPRSAMNELLMQWLGLGLEDTQQRGLEFLTYLEQFDAYYSVASDTNMVIPEFSSGVRREDGMIELHYCARWSNGADTHILVLRPVGESYQFVSNLPIDNE